MKKKSGFESRPQFRRIWQAIQHAHPRGVLMIVSLMLLIVSQNAASLKTSEYAWIATSISFISLIFFLLGFQSRALPQRLRKFLTWPSRFFSITPAQSIYLLFSISLSIIASTSNGYGPYQETMSTTVSLWLLSIFFIFIGTWQADNAFLPSKRTLLQAAGLGAAAFIVRFVSITSIPATLTGDEASMGMSAKAFIEGNANNIFSVGWFSFPSLFYFVESFFIRIFGNTTLALRLPSTLVGALTVSIVFLLGRALFGKSTGWFAAIFLIGFHFHIHFSRLGLNNIWDGLSIALVLGAFWYGWKHNKRVYFVLSGFTLGIAQYFYVSSKLLPFLILGWIVIAYFLDREKLKKHTSNLVILAMTALIVVAPLAFYFFNNPGEFMAPINRVRLSPEWIEMTATRDGLYGWQVLANQIWTGLKGFTHEPLRAWYMPGTPMLRPAPAAIFLLGVFLLLFRLKDLQAWLVLFVLLGFGVVSGLSFDPPAAQRYVAVAPWLALVAGYTAGETTARLKGFWPGISRLLMAVAIIFFAWLAFDDARFYFNDYTPPTTDLIDNNAVAQRLASYLKAHPEIQELYFLGSPRMGYYSIQSTNFLVPDVVGVDINENWGSGDNPEIKSDEPFFVLLPHKEADLKAIMDDYPDGKLFEVQNNASELIFWIYDSSKSN